MIYQLLKVRQFSFFLRYTDFLGNGCLSRNVYYLCVYVTVHAGMCHKSVKKSVPIFCGFRTISLFPMFVANLKRIGHCVAELRLLLYAGVGKLTSAKRQFLHVYTRR